MAFILCARAKVGKGLGKSFCLSLLCCAGVYNLRLHILHCLTHTELYVYYVVSRDHLFAAIESIALYAHAQVAIYDNKAIKYISESRIEDNHMYICSKKINILTVYYQFHNKSGGSVVACVLIEAKGFFA